MDEQYESIKNKLKKLLALTERGLHLAVLYNQ